MAKLITIKKVVEEGIFPEKDEQGIRDWLSKGVIPKEFLTKKIGKRRYFIKERLDDYILGSA